MVVTNYSCVPGVTVCFEGRGRCDVDSLQCICNEEYITESEYYHDTYCSVHIIGSKALNSLCVIIWALTLLISLGGILFFKREKAELRQEKAMLANIALIAVLFIVSVILQLSADPYGSRQHGVYIGTTVIYGIASVLEWTFILLKPIIFGSASLAASALAYAQNTKKIYFLIVPFLCAGTFVSSLLPILNVYMPENDGAIVSIIYVSSGPQ